MNVHWFNSPDLDFISIVNCHGKWRAKKEALVCGDVRQTWAQLHDHTNRVANGLIAMGIGQGDMVGLVMDNCAEAIESHLGIAKAGACAVPINLTVTDKSMTAMLNDSNVQAIVATEPQVSRLEEVMHELPVAAQENRLVVGSADGWKSFQDFKQESEDNNPDVIPSPDAPMNVIYSSGTTGVPKGIVHSYKSRLFWALLLLPTFRYHTVSRTLSVIGHYSNFNVMPMLCSFLVGGTFVISEAFKPEETLALMEQEKITNSAMVPIMLQMMLDVPGQEKYDLSSINAIVSAGSPLFEGLKRRVFKRFGNDKIIEVYGLTEGGMTSMDPELAQDKMASVGWPMIGSDAKLLDANDKEVPIGENGELVFWAPSVMTGYLNREEANQETTWTDDRGRRWLRTGDIARRDADNELYIVDRKKDMILSGAQNIYPQDIEAVAIAHEMVAQVAVVAVKSERWGETPLAIIVPADPSNFDAEAVKTYINSNVGRRERIADVVVTDQLPMNVTGKLLKRELRESYKHLVYP